MADKAPLKTISKVSDKAKALQDALGQIEKSYGKGAIMRLGEGTQASIEHISTGSLALDLALGIGGVPRGRIIEIFGPESSGKTTLSLHVIAEAQKNGGEVAFIDAEHALDPVYAKNLGVDIDSLMVAQPDTGEQALEITEALVRSNAIDCIIVDSVAALVPKAEIQGEMGDSHMGLQARLMSQALRKLTGFVKKSNTTVIFINQLRDKVGGSAAYGPNETTSGGRALKFYASVRLDIRRIDSLKVGDDLVGNRVKVKVAKNKVAPPFKVVHFDIMFGKGISREGDILDLGVEFGLIAKSGAWFSYKGNKLGQGRENCKTFLADNPKIADELIALIKEKDSQLVLGEKKKSVKKGKGKKASDDEADDDANGIDGLEDLSETEELLLADANDDFLGDDFSDDDLSDIDVELTEDFPKKR